MPNKHQPLSNMPEKIGRVDFSSQILKFLKLYNKAKGKLKKIQKAALKRIDRFLNVFFKILIVNCVEMLNALKLVTLTSKILYTVYDITVHGNTDESEQFTKETFHQFQNVLFKDRLDPSTLSYDHASTLKSKTFDLQTKQLIHKVLGFWGITTNPKSTESDLLIEFLLMKLFDASGDCEIITTEVLEAIGRLPDFVKLDTTLGSYGILSTDEIEVSSMEIETDV